MRKLSFLLKIKQKVFMRHRLLTVGLCTAVLLSSSSLVYAKGSYSAPRVSAPRVSTPRVSTPHYSAPRVSTPSRPSYSAPRVSTPRVTTPNSGSSWSMPKISTPRVSTPNVSLPKISAPKFSMPKINWPQPKPKVTTPTPRVAPAPVPSNHVYHYYGYNGFMPAPAFYYHSGPSWLDFWIFQWMWGPRYSQPAPQTVIVNPGQNATPSATIKPAPKSDEGQFIKDCKKHFWQFWKPNC